jgi:hypothetical protein
MRRTPSLRSVAVAGLLAALAGAAPAGGSESPRSVVGTARAQGVRVTYTIPDYVVVSEFFDGGGPVTEALADSTGRATSFSSLPWPGSNAVTAPGTLSVALGQSVPLAYPFHVRADHPTTPEASLRDPSGAYDINAAAEAGKATAAGSFEAPGEVSGSRAWTSAVLDDDGVVRVVAETVDTGIAIGDGALRIASVRSRSETTLSPGDPKPVTVSELVVEGASVGGKPVTIDAEGLHAADQTVPAPIGEGASTDNDLLGQAGISVSVVPTGVTGGADALVITSRQRMPLPANPKGTLVLRIGGAASEIVVGSTDLDLETPATPGGEGPVQSEAGPEPATAPAASPVAPSDERNGRVPDEVVSFVRQPLDFPLPSAAALVPPDGPAEIPLAVGGTAVGAATTAGARRPVVPDLATTGALFSLLAGGSLALVVATRLHRLRIKKARP